MASFSLVFKRSVARDLRPLPAKDVTRILQRIEALADDPRGSGCEKLSGQERYRVRQGTYRILYEFHDRELVIVVVKVGPRREIYRHL